MQRMNLHRLREQIKRMQQIGEQQYALFAQKQQSRIEHDFAHWSTELDSFIKRAKDKPNDNPSTSQNRMG